MSLIKFGRTIIKKNVLYLSDLIIIFIIYNN